ncbi:hypothetical protein BASA62_006704 [Batrachochytrium salamandrivorans]|nr:hypothetical protein BASA62_006704 [Batrachochytrium salamandrivorans]
MKFNALVAAAMVITSVNASGKGRPKGLFKKGGGMKGSDSSWSLLEKDPEPGSSQESLVHRSKSGPSQDSLAHGSKSRPSQSSQRHKPRPKLSQSLAMHRLRSALSSKPPRHKPGKIQVPEPRKKDPVCDPIARELHASWKKISVFDKTFSKQIPDFYKLLRKEREKKDDKDMMKMRMAKLREEYGVEEMSEGEEEMDEEERIKAEALIVEAIQKWIESHPEAIPRLREIQAEYISLEKDHLVIWAKLVDSKCSTERLETLSPEYMKKDGYFPEWDFETNLMSFDDQQNHI